MNFMPYRGKRYDNGGWVEGDLVYTRRGVCISVRPLNLFRVIPETVGIASGVPDKNGKVISQGDIVSWCSRLFIVRFGEYNKEVGLGYYYGVGFFLEKVGDPDFIVPLNAQTSGDYEILGNSSDNPELLSDGCVE